MHSGYISDTRSRSARHGLRCCQSARRISSCSKARRLTRVCRNGFVRRAPVLFHICFEVEDIDGALTELKAKGIKLRDEKPRIGHAGARIAFIDPASTGNVLIELAELPSARSS